MSTLQFMEEILHQLSLVVYPIVYRVLYIPGGCSGFQPINSMLQEKTAKTKIFSESSEEVGVLTHCLLKGCMSIHGLLSKRWRSKLYVLQIFTSLPFTKKPPSMDWFGGHEKIEIPWFLLQVVNHEDRFLKYELVYRLCINIYIYCTCIQPH